MLFRFFILLISAFTFSGTSIGQELPKNSLLWMISGKDLSRPSYVFGTFHMMCKSDFAITDPLKEKLNATEQFYGELDMDDPGLQMSMMNKMRLKDKTLKDLMSEADYTTLSENFQRVTGMQLQLFNQFMPFMSLSLLTLNSIECSDKIQPEGEFVKLAQQQKLPILGLETIDDQIEAINSQPLDSQLHSLKKMVLAYDSVKQSMNKMIAVYKENNVDKLYDFIRANSNGDDRFETEMLAKRNKRWIPIIEKAMHEKPSFFAVGAGHLGGNEGVLELLRKQGYTLTPVLY
ncbi:MAG: TraB/GumN family protein [Sediminibacterium sp.]|uniref:TraB/GumN family protein n=1 Tax=Sediminibacterium sp. TaxID=1917865 RepID=UPI002ABA5F78|nr:TraB/GumN family protein [Sediminibacterium sp.]MDZ4071708.1 TraB/GumN family protein [Sediminibacterium sp.]